MAITQANLAKFLKISQSTVSLCFSNPGVVAEDTLKQVMEAADQLGYRANTGARAIRKGRFDNLTLVIGAAGPEKRGRGWMPLSMARGVSKEAQDQGLGVSICELEDQKIQSDTFMPEFLRKHNTDGLLINYIMQLPPTTQAAIARLKLPAVYLNRLEQHNSVYADDFHAGKTVTQTLIQLGHTQIVFASWGYPEERSHYSSLERQKGYLHAMQENQLQPQLLAEPKPLIYRQPLEQAQAWLARYPTATAWVLDKDVDLQRLWLAASALGKRVPEELSLISFSEGDAKDAARLPWSAYELPFYDMGKAAVQMIQDLITNRKQVTPSVAVPGALREGITLTSAPEGS